MSPVSPAGLKTSLEYTQSNLETQSDKARDTLVKTLEQTARTQPASSGPDPTVTGLLITGLGEDIKGQALQAEVDKLLHTDMEVETPVHQIETFRLGRPDTEAKRPRPCCGHSASERLAVLRAAYKLRQLNAARKEEGSLTIGVDTFLTREQKAVKDSLWPKFKQAKEAGHPRTYFRGCKLFVKGVEVQP